MARSDLSTWRSGLVLVISILGFVAGTAVLAYETIHQWMSPPTPLVLAATAAFLPVVALNAVVGLVFSGEDEPVEQSLRLPVVASLITGILVTGAAASWFSPEVRARGLARAVERGWTDTAGRALDDPNAGIVTSACASLFEGGIDDHRERVLGLLDARPATAGRCLRRAKDTPSSGALAEVLAERWHRELLASRGRSRRKCRLAAQLGGLPRASTAGVPALLSCSLSAADEKTRTCCTKSLLEAAGSGDDLADAMGGSVVRIVSEQLAAPLVQASLHRLQMSEAGIRRADRLGLDAPGVGRYAAAMACAHVRMASYPNDVTDQLSAWLETADCPTTIEDPDENLTGWREVCGHVSRLVPNASDPDELLCNAVRARAVREAVARARSNLESAFSGADYQFMQARIAAGVAMKRGRRRGPLGVFGRMADRGFGKSVLMRRILRHMEDEENREEIEKLVVATRAVRREGVEGPAEDVDDLELDEKTRERYEKLNKSNAYQRFEQLLGEDESSSGSGEFRRLRGSGPN